MSTGGKKLIEAAKSALRYIRSLREGDDPTNVGAPEGAVLNFHHFQVHDDSGSKLSVRADYNPSRGGNS